MTPVAKIENHTGFVPYVQGSASRASTYADRLVKDREGIGFSRRYTAGRYLDPVLLEAYTCGFAGAENVISVMGDVSGTAPAPVYVIRISHSKLSFVFSARQKIAYICS